VRTVKLEPKSEGKAKKLLNDKSTITTSGGRNGTSPVILLEWISRTNKFLRDKNGASPLSQLKDCEIN
jgi:hypothetical protein